MLTRSEPLLKSTVALCTYPPHTKLRSNKFFMSVFDSTLVLSYLSVLSPRKQVFKYSTVVLEFIFESYVFNIKIKAKKIKDKKKCLLILCDCFVRILSKDDCD